MGQPVAVDLYAWVRDLGGVTTRAELLDHASRSEIARALRSGELVNLGAGRYAVPQVDEAVRAAHGLCGRLCRESAALYYGWAVKEVPELPHVTVPKKRRIEAARRVGVQLHRDDLHPDDVDDIATSKEYTLAQCLRTCSFDAALAVADSALRAGESPGLLRRVANTARGPGARQVRRVVKEASADAANPFESVLRAIALDVPGLRVRPQCWIGRGQRVRPDLVDEDLGIVLEADSFEWHGGRAALRRDARRYNGLVVEGWLVLRFSWEDVMFEQQHLHRQLVSAVDLASRRTYRAA